MNGFRYGKVMFKQLRMKHYQFNSETITDMKHVHFIANCFSCGIFFNPLGAGAKQNLFVTSIEQDQPAHSHSVASLYTVG